MADRIVTGDGTTVLENKAVCITDNGKISEIGDFASLKAKHPDHKIKKYDNASILPGLIDMHVHISHYLNKTSTYNDFQIAYLAAANAREAFSKGITTFRDVSSPKNLCISMNKAVEEGYLEIPRIIYTDAPLCIPGGHGSANGIEVTGPWEIRAAIRDLIKRGAQWIKVMTSHRSDISEFTQEELDAVVSECKRLGKKTAVHAGTQPSIQMCIDAGFSTIEHGTYLTVPQARQMKEKNIVWVPTIVAYTKTYEYIMENSAKSITDKTGSSFVRDQIYFRDAAAQYREHFKELYDTGVTIATGTDLIYNGAPITPVPREMKYMVDYGMPAIEAIRAATKTGAETLGIDDITGEIAVGKLADIAIVAGNPLQDIGVMEKVLEVYLSGKSVYSA